MFSLAAWIDGDRAVTSGSGTYVETLINIVSGIGRELNDR